jgi:hypothetical protein
MRIDERSKAGRKLLLASGEANSLQLGGKTAQETAHVIGVSATTVERTRAMPSHQAYHRRIS